MGRILLGLAATGVVTVVTPAGRWLYLSFDCQTDLRRADYIICLGGDPVRVLEATRLLEEGRAETLIVSDFGVTARLMRDAAVEWGAPAERVLVDDQSRRTADHAESIARNLGVDPEDDVCIIVTSYLHLPRAAACFEKAGYRHIIPRELRWERAARQQPGWQFGVKARFRYSTHLIYEYAAWVEYWVRGYV